MTEEEFDELRPSASVTILDVAEDEIQRVRPRAVSPWTASNSLSVSAPSAPSRAISFELLDEFRR